MPNYSLISLIVCLSLLLPVTLITAQVTKNADAFHTMTLEQKVAQMFMVSFFGTQLTEAESDFLRQVQPGAVCFLAATLNRLSK